MQFFLNECKLVFLKGALAWFPCLFFLFVPECSNITEMRKVYKDAFLKKHNIKLGFMSAFVKAAAYALVDQPAVNAGISLHQQLVIFLTSSPHSTTSKYMWLLRLCAVRLRSRFLNYFSPLLPSEPQKPGLHRQATLNLDFIF